MGSDRPQAQNLSQEELESAFGEAARIQDEIYGATDLPIAEPLDPGRRAGSDVRSLRILVLLIAAFLGVQTVELALRFAKPPPTSDNVVAQPTGTADTVTNFVDNTLIQSRQHIDDGFYQQVVDMLTPLLESENSLLDHQRYEINMLLAKAHRHLGNVNKQSLYQVRAMDFPVSHGTINQLLREAGNLISERRYQSARKIYFEILALADQAGSVEEEKHNITQILLADSYQVEALHHKDYEELPGQKYRNYVVDEGGQP